ncbi:PEFG-CTERM sorting domain-containing protein [Nitrosopumilus sp.]|nr:PEFG-CTERM sorting domain-containing protein [Nitrosopumilus sp.]
MHIRIFSTLMILTLVFGGTAFASTSLISVQTDDSNYDEGDTILISGNISTIIGDTQVTLQLFQEGNLIDIAQIKVGKDGNYSHTIIAEGPQWMKNGDYIVKTSYGEANMAEILFTYNTKAEIIETIDNLVVNAGDSGTFDIRYTIVGGIVESTVIDPNIFGIILKIDSLDEGKIILDLPREFIDAEKQNGKDEQFIILIDDVQTVYKESISNSDIRKITINFEPGDSEIQIIGTYVIPEFGTIAMIILTIGIMVSILLTKNKFQIKL